MKTDKGIAYKFEANRNIFKSFHHDCMLKHTTMVEYLSDYDRILAFLINIFLLVCNIFSNILHRGIGAASQKLKLNTIQAF